MVSLKPTNQQESKALTTDNRELRFKYLVGLIVISVLLHGLGLFLYAKFQPQDSNQAKKSSSKPIDFVVVEPPESTKEELPQSEKQDRDNSVEPPVADPEEPPIAEPTSPSATAVPPNTVPPVSETVPEVPENTSVPETPVLSGADPALKTEPEPKPEAKKVEPIPAPSAEPEEPVATALPPSKQSQSPPTESIPTNPPNSASETDKIATGSGAASLLGGDLQKNYEEDGAQAFFSPEALEYEAVLDPQQLQALQGFDLAGYQKRLYDRVKRNWKPTFRQKYTTWLTFNIEKNGQISQLQVVESSGSNEFDQVALEAVKNAVPLEPLPADFPLENLEFKYQFYLY